MKSSSELWNSIGDNAEKYLSVLRKIAVDFTYYRTISVNYNLVANMKKKPILVAVKKKNSNSTDEEKIYSLASAKEIYSNDDMLYQEIFNPLTIPEEEVMKTLYNVCYLLLEFI